MSLALTLHYAAQGVHIASQSSARTKHGIIWNCLAVIFSCTWLAIHPNIPGPNISRWVIFLRRVRLIFVAMVAPEAVMMWAMKQWIAAYKLGKKYKCMFALSPKNLKLIADIALILYCLSTVRMDPAPWLFCHHGRFLGLR